VTTPLTIAGLRESFLDDRSRSDAVSAHIGRATEGTDRHRVWIEQLDAQRLRPYIDRLATLDVARTPLWGVPFAVKDNIDLAGVPTTAGCPEYAYVPERSAPVVERLVAAGAIPLGKTNMDQFATGLVGTRSPYGATRNALNPDWIAGGSSSGSAVAVKLGLAAFALGTDTAGSGRVPAAFNAIVGFKPTRGWWSTRGVVPACRSLDCVSVFANSVDDARRVTRIAGGFDAGDPFARRMEFRDFDPCGTRFGYFEPTGLRHTTEPYRRLYADFVDNLPGAPVPIDPRPFVAAGELLYGGPWLAERLVACGEILGRNPDALHPVTRAVIERGGGFSAEDGFRAAHHLAALRREVEEVLATIDVLVLPTTPVIFARSEVEEAPFDTNTRLGTFTNFVNLLDLCAVAIPAGVTSCGMPFGVSLIGTAGSDYALLNAAAALRGESTEPVPGTMRLAVCGAHMAGQPLNGALTSRGGYRLSVTRTAPRYRLFALPDGIRPALVRADAGGGAIELEVWSLPEREVGGILASIGPPLALGTVELADGTSVHGFVAGNAPPEDATDITRFGGWRNYRSRATD